MRYLEQRVRPNPTDQVSSSLQESRTLIDWCYTFYNHQRRHSAADGLSPVNYEIRESKTKPEAA